SSLAHRIASWEEALPKHIKLAYLPDLDRMRLRLSAKGLDERQIIDDVQNEIDKLMPLVKDEFFDFDDDDESIELAIGQKLAALEKTVATAESCTGGKIAERFVANSGSSAYFKGSIVSYATQSKIDVL